VAGAVEIRTVAAHASPVGRVRRYGIFLALAILGCGGSLTVPDGGSTGSGGAGAMVPAALEAQLYAARQTWMVSKTSCTVYSYDRRMTSVFGGASSTQVEIQNDRATRRRYWTYAMRAELDGGYGWMLSWDETGSELDIHDGAYPAYSIEQLLAECETILTQDPTQNQLVLTIGEGGVPSTCSYRPNGCADDCTSGIEIASFACVPLTDAAPSF